MKKFLLRTAAIMLAMALAISGVELAFAEEGTEESQTQVRALTIDAPAVVQVDETLTITVRDGETGKPVEDASVYALGWPLRIMPYTSTEDSAPAKRPYFKHLGDTGSDGSVTTLFERPGRFLIIATKGGYVPAVAWLNVKPNVIGKLEIRAPRRAEVNQPVSLTILDRYSGDVVPEADVWAVRLPMRSTHDDQIPSISDAGGLLEELRELNDGEPADVLNRLGMHLGQTGDDGTLKATFSDVGAYILVSTKSGYIPGIKSIVIASDMALAIRVPRWISVDEDVTIKVVTRGTATPVEGAEVYALAGSFTLNLADVKDNWDSLRDLVLENGIHIGTTDNEGEVKDYQFADEGRYPIVGIKDGYVPGLTFTTVVAEFDGLRDRLPGMDRFRARIQLGVFGDYYLENGGN